MQEEVILMAMCKTCLYNDAGCRRFPPQPKPDRGAMVYAFPQVPGDCWCGEWKSKRKPKREAPE